MNTDPHKTHSYSHDYLLMTAFEYELMNTLSQIKDPKVSAAKDIVEVYLRARVHEIKERWKPQ